MVNKKITYFFEKIKKTAKKDSNFFLSKFKNTKEKAKNNEKINHFIEISKNVLSKAFFLVLPIIKTFYKRIQTLLENNPELKKRTKYGIIFSISLLFILLCGGVVYIIAMFIVFCIMSYELLKMVSNIEQSNNKMFVYLRGFGLIYIAVCCISFVLIRESQQGLRISFWMFITIWSVDVFAYIFGKKFGKVKLAPEISPNKTYEGAILGTIGGLFVSMCLYRLLATHSEHSFSMISFLIFSLIVIILAQMGDLSESYIKRQCGVKDSGNILPGHGGLFDRFDSFLITTTFIFIIVWLNDGVLF